MKDQEAGARQQLIQLAEETKLPYHVKAVRDFDNAERLFNSLENQLSALSPRIGALGAAIEGTRESWKTAPAAPSL